MLLLSVDGFGRVFRAGTHLADTLISVEAEHVRSCHIDTRGDLREFQEASISTP